MLALNGTELVPRCCGWSPWLQRNWRESAAEDILPILWSPFSVSCAVACHPRLPPSSSVCLSCILLWFYGKMSVKRLMDWHAWSPAGGTVGWVMEPLGDGAFVGGSISPWAGLRALEPRHTSCSLASLRDYGCHGHLSMFLPLCLSDHHRSRPSATVGQSGPLCLPAASVMAFCHSNTSETGTHHFPVSC